MRKTYTGLLLELPENGVFVFGSNTQGRHGGGAALAARNHFGAIYGQAKGLQGRSYAIVTKDLTKYTHPSVSIKQIKSQIKDLYDYARINPNVDFYIAYARSGTNLNAYTPKQMAEMFALDGNVPENIVFESEFFDLVYEHINSDK